MDVTVVGSCNIDLVSYVPRLPTPGETIIGSRFVSGYGGKGANPCMAAARLGAKTTLVSKVGDDNFGRDYLDNLKKNGIDISNIGIVKDISTGMAPIFVNESGENSIVVVPGANMHITCDDINGKESIIKNSKVIMCSNEIEQTATLQALKLAKKHKVRSLFNFAPMQKYLQKELVQASDILIINESEAEALTDNPVSSHDEVKQAISKLLTMGCDTAIVTLGADGAMFASRSNSKVIHVPGQKVEPVDTTGAGDAFCGSLGFFLSTMPSLSLEESIRRANIVAAFSVQRVGTQTSYLTRQELPQELFS